MADDVETKEKAQEVSSDPREKVAGETRLVIEDLKSEMKKIDEDATKVGEAKKEAKKECIRQRLAALTEVQVEALKTQIDHTPELVNALAGIHEVIEEKRNALKAQVEAGQKKPEGYLAMFNSGYEKVKEAGQSIWNALKDFKDHPVESTVAGLASTWVAFKSGWAWLSEKTARVFAPLIAPLDDMKYVPDGVKNFFNSLLGDFGVLYKHLAKRRVELIPNNLKEEPSLDAFMEEYRSLADNGKEVTFDQFCKAAVLKARNGRLGALKVTQAELEKAGAQAAVELGKTPAVIPASAPGAAPAAAVAPEATPAAAPEDASKVFTFDTVPSGTNLLGVPRKLQFGDKALTILASADGTFQIDAVKYKLRIKKQIPFWGEELFSPSVSKLEWKQGGLDCSGSWLGIKQNQVIERKVLESFLQRHLNGETRIDTPKILLEKIS
ncbi:MAG: hypothetical protein PHE68_03660 [Candidatus Peribacteraceae bacterium]|nr:hypothetical protein [Candidatus Peribacteraceae bacterium]MDD5074842.1 hypothetical protein [Candidatus Peribacteraceae bacterium]